MTEVDTEEHLSMRILQTAALAAVILGASVICSAGIAVDTPSTTGAKFYFVNLKDGATVSEPLKVIFGLSSMGSAPAGTENEGTGQQHLFIYRPEFGQEP